jgi:hypothetical protein
MTVERQRSVATTFVDGHPADVVESQYTPTRGAILLYVARESKPDYEASDGAEPSKTDPERGVIAAFSAYVPAAALAKDPLVLKFRVRDASQGDAPSIDVSNGS